MNTAKYKTLLTKEQIAQQVKKTALQIHRDFTGKDLVILSVLKGALCLTADLIRAIDLPLTLETIQCASYGQGGAQRSELKIIGADRLQLQNRDVLIIDDIYDTGHTMNALLHTLSAQKPRSLQSCVLLYKKNVPKITSYRPEYILFEIDDLFVVGYGLDFKELHRGLPDVCIWEGA